MDQAARFRELFEPARDAIYRICCCYLRDAEDRRDAFQEVALLLGFLLHAKGRSLARMDYSRPVKEFLAEAEQRYRFMRPVDLTYSVPLLFVLALTGGRVVLDVLVPRYVEAHDAAVVVSAYVVFFLGICGLGYYFTYRNWQKDHAAVCAEIRRMRQEME